MNYAPHLLCLVDERFEALSALGSLGSIAIWKGLGVFSSSTGQVLSISSAERFMQVPLKNGWFLQCKMIRCCKVRYKP
jgi:hypothetical protein